MVALAHFSQHPETVLGRPGELANFTFSDMKAALQEHLSNHSFPSDDVTDRLVNNTPRRLSRSGVLFKPAAICRRQPLPGRSKPPFADFPSGDTEQTAVLSLLQQSPPPPVTPPCVLRASAASRRISARRFNQIISELSGPRFRQVK